MTKLKNDAWVVVADGEKALFLRNVTDGEDPNLEVIRKEEQDNPKDIDQSANRPGRVGQSAGPGKSAYDDTDWHELAKDRFAADLADMLYERAHKGSSTTSFWSPRRRSLESCVASCTRKCPTRSSERSTRR